MVKPDFRFRVKLREEILRTAIEEAAAAELRPFDAAYDYPQGFADSRTALRLVRPGGVVLWDMFYEGYPGLVHAIIEATAGLPLKRLGVHTALGFLRTMG